MHCYHGNEEFINSLLVQDEQEKNIDGGVRQWNSLRLQTEATPMPLAHHGFTTAKEEKAFKGGFGNEGTYSQPSLQSLYG